MKLNVLIQKKHLILAGLVVVLGVAVYLNWEFSQKDINLGNPSDEKVYGQAQETNVKVSETGDEYFAQARLNRQKKRDEAIESVQTMLSDKSITQSQKNEISTKAAELATLSQCESTIEELVKAKGFRECVAFVDGETASVVVSSKGLSDAQAAQIFDIVVSKTKINSEKINIVEVK